MSCPTSSDNVCITIAGTYSVTITGSSASAGTLVLGASSGKESLKILGNPSGNGQLTLSAATGSEIKTDGVLKLVSKNVVGAGYAMIAGGPSVTLENKGTFQTSGGQHADIYLRVDITNDSSGTVKIKGDNSLEDGGAGATNITNNGTFTVTSTGSLSVSSGSSFTHAGGTLSNVGAFAQSDGTFTQSGGTDSGNAISLSNSSTLADSSGAGSFDLFGSDTLSGTIPAGQTVDAIGNPTNNTEVTLGTNVTNNGTFELDSETASGSGYAILYQSSSDFTFTNSGTGTFETLGATISPDYLRSDITNDSGGTFTIDGADTAEDGGNGATTFANDGTLSVGAGGGITVSSSSSFTQSAGTLANSGSFTVSDGTFTQSGGTDSGNAISITSSKLVDSAGGGSFNLFGSDTLSGTLPAGQTVDAIGNPTSPVEVTLGTNVTNNGTFELDSLTTSGSGYAMLYQSSSDFTFTNSGTGTFETLGATISPDYLRADITNDSGGTFTIDGANTAEDGGGGATTLHQRRNPLRRGRWRSHCVK